MSTPNSNSKNATVIIPDVNKTLIQTANTIIPVSLGVTALVIMITMRAQVSSTLTQLDKSDIQQLESIKWNAKQIAKSPIIREFAAALVIAQTFNFEFTNIKDMSPKEVQDHAKSLVQELAQTPASPGNKILAPRAVRDHNLMSHRLGLLAQKIGNWQAKPLFEPSSIIKNTPVATFTPELLKTQILLLHQLFEIDLDELLMPENKIEGETEEECLTKILNKAIYFTSNQQTIELVFEDPIRLKSEDNKTPLERLIPFMQRPIPVEKISTQSLPESLLDNPLIKFASMVNESQEKSNRKELDKFKSRNQSSNSSQPVTSAKAKVKAKPKAKAKAKVEYEVEEPLAESEN